MAALLRSIFGYPAFIVLAALLRSVFGASAVYHFGVLPHSVFGYPAFIVLAALLRSVFGAPAVYHFGALPRSVFSASAVYHFGALQNVIFSTLPGLDIFGSERGAWLGKRETLGSAKICVFSRFLVVLTRIFFGGVYNNYSSV